MTNALRPEEVAFIGSGGAIKGVAHLGVLRALEAVGVRPGIFVGASAGALVNALYAQGFSVDTMLSWLDTSGSDDRNILKLKHFLGLPSPRSWLSPGYITSGLLSLERFERFLAKTLPVNDFAALEHPLLVTAADIDGRGRAVFGRGYIEHVTISQAVAASCCVPLLFRPFEIGGRYYIDGEVVRTLSLDLAVEAGAKVVIISNVYRAHVPRRRERSLAFRGAAAVGRQSLNMMLSEKEKRGLDLLHRLYPDVVFINVSADLGQFPFLGKQSVSDMVRRGYREALRVLRSAERNGLLSGDASVRGAT